MRYAIAFFLFVLAGCASFDGAPSERGAPIRPEVFFEGRTRGEGVLVDRAGNVERRFTVRSNGMPLPDGSFSINQRIEFDDGEVQTRRWTMRPDGPDDYIGVLTDASGIVRASVREDALRIRYPLADAPLARMEQFLYLTEPGTVVNVGTVRVGGVTVLRLREIIERVPSE